MKTQILLTMIAAGFATPLLAQPAGGNDGSKRGQQPPPPPPILVALDTNKDGVISAEELAAASTSLKTLDKNADGQLTKDEFCPRPPRKKNDSKSDKKSSRRPPPPSPLVGAVDADHDRTISAAEIVGASTALATLDKNADGQLTRDEFAPPPPRRQHHGTSSGSDTDDTPESR